MVSLRSEKIQGMCTKWDIGPLVRVPFKISDKHPPPPILFIWAFPSSPQLIPLENAAFIFYWPIACLVGVKWERGRQITMEGGGLREWIS